MKVLVLAPAIHDSTPGQRFRIEQWARYLEPEGVNFTFIPFGDSTLHHVLYQPGRYAEKAVLMLRAFFARFAVLAQAQQHDVIYLFREAALVGPAVIERQLARLRVPIVYDFDDPIWLAYRSPQNGVFSRLKFPGKTAAICRLATRVVTGNRLLADWARQHSASVDIVPSTVDMQKYPAKSHNHRAPVTLGWSGSHSTLPFLELVQETLIRLAGSRHFKLLVISHTDNYRNERLPVPTVSKRWCATTEAMDLHEMDIGLAPFPNSGWTPWRCHGKVLQYMAAGIPCVASNIGILPDYIQDGVNGFLAASDDEWIDKLRMLIDDPNLRRRMGAAARQTIEVHYSAAVWAPQVRRILEEARAQRQMATFPMRRTTSPDEETPVPFGN